MGNRCAVLFNNRKLLCRVFYFEKHANIKDKDYILIDCL